MEMLSKSFADPLYESNPDVSTSVFEMQIFAIFDITVLSHVAKSSKSIIGVSGTGTNWNACFEILTDVDFDCVHALL